MKLTRDSALWWVLLVSGIVGVLTGHNNVLHAAFPTMGPQWDARLELFAFALSVVGAFLRMSPLALSQDHPLASAVPDANRTLSINGKPAILLALALGAASSACAGTARHVAVVADASIAQAVFALDDAEYAACHQQHVLSAEQCAKLDPIIKKALVDVKALTAALQAAPKDGQLPSTLPALLKDLNDIGAVIDALGAGPTFSGLAAKARQANATILGLLTQFAGGQ
jgi:hypothetical protein